MKAKIWFRPRSVLPDGDLYLSGVVQDTTFELNKRGMEFNYHIVRWKRPISTQWQVSPKRSVFATSTEPEREKKLEIGYIRSTDPSHCEWSVERRDDLKAGYCSMSVPYASIGIYEFQPRDFPTYHEIDYLYDLSASKVYLRRKIFRRDVKETRRFLLDVSVYDFQIVEDNL